MESLCLLKIIINTENCFGVLALYAPFKQPALLQFLIQPLRTSLSGVLLLLSSDKQNRFEPTIQVGEDEEALATRLPPSLIYRYPNTSTRLPLLTFFFISFVFLPSVQYTRVLLVFIMRQQWYRKYSEFGR